MKEIADAIRKVVNADVALEIPPDPKLGDFAFPCFSLSKTLKKSPQQIAAELAKKIEKPKSVERIEVNGPYLNFFLKKSALAEDVIKKIRAGNYGRKNQGKTVMVEFLSPNTNKPLHLGHLRNLFLGMAVSNTLEFLGNKVIRANLVNDRGVHICKSMLAYDKWGNGREPDKKPDHFVGDFYVLYSKNENDALKAEIQQMLVRWEKKDQHVRALWKKMNKWAIKGFKETYKALGVQFDKEYMESGIYGKGREIVLDGLKNGIFSKNEQGIIADLKKENLGEKVLLRSDGTSVYITQDIYLAMKKFSDYNLDRSIYVVGSEQDYHFKVLISVLHRLNFSHAAQVYHLSYGMVFLPEGKMKSREGKVVDADDIMAEISSLARKEVDKRYPKLSENEKIKRSKKIGYAALRFYLLRTDSSKSMMYHPEESLSFEGETGPYVQYTYTRISSILRKYKKAIPSDADYGLLSHELEKKLIVMLSEFPDVIETAGNKLRLHLIPHFLLSLSQAFNEYYHQCPIIREEESLRDARIVLIWCVREVLHAGLDILNIDAIERM